MRLVSGLSPRWTGLSPRSVHLWSMVSKVALGQVFLPVIRGSPVSISHCLYTRRHLHVFLSIRTQQPSLEIFQKSNSVRKSWTISCKGTITFPVFRMLIAEVFYAVPFAFSVSLYTALTYEFARWEMFILNTCNSLRMLYAIHFSYISKSMVLAVTSKEVYLKLNK
jgi:hypothetical protein